RLDRARGPAGRVGRGCRRLGRGRGVALAALAGARLHRFLPQPVQPRPHRLPRRRPDLALAALPPAGRRAAARGARRGGLRIAGRAARRRHVRRSRRPEPAVTRPDEDRAILERVETDLDRHVAMIADEFRAGFQTVERIGRPGVTVYGSARITEAHRAYGLAREVGRRFADAGFAVVTGGGPGVMEAANRGCHEAGGLSVGFNIELPHEQVANGYLDLELTFRHFYARKTMLVKAGSAPSTSCSSRSSSSRLGRSTTSPWCSSGASTGAACAPGSRSG